MCAHLHQRLTIEEDIKGYDELPGVDSFSLLDREGIEKDLVKGKFGRSLIKQGNSGHALLEFGVDMDGGANVGMSGDEAVEMSGAEDDGGAVRMSGDEDGDGAEDDIGAVRMSGDEDGS